nr:hypothetical protein BDOA9_0150660 [Bradyrhizobium sp. DOA9]
MGVLTSGLEWIGKRRGRGPRARLANLNKRRSWTPCIRMRHSIPRKAAQNVAILWAGSQTKDGAAIHREERRIAICMTCHAFHLTADAVNSKIFARGVEDRHACAG